MYNLRYHLHDKITLGCDDLNLEITSAFLRRHDKLDDPYMFNMANTKPPSMTTGFPWSHIKERWHHTRPDDWKPTWNQTHRKTKNHMAEGPHYTSKHQLRGSVDSFPERVQYDDIGMIMNKNGLVCDQKE